MTSVLAAGPRGLLLPGHVSPAPPSAFAVPNGLVGYWGFDADCMDLTNARALDLSGNGNHGTLIASPTVAPGQICNALNCNGTTQGITCPTTALLLIQAVSVSIWVNTGALTNAYSIIAA